MRAVRALTAIFFGLVAIVALLIWWRSLNHYDALRTCIGTTLLEAKSAGGAIRVEWTRNWPSPQSVGRHWDHWAAAEYSLPDIRAEQGVLGVGYETNQIAVLSDESQATTQSDEAAVALTSRVTSRAVVVPLWLIAALAMIPPAMWTVRRVRRQPQPAGNTDPLIPDSDSPA